MKLITEGWETPGNELAFCICVVSRTECVLLNSFWRGINNYAFARGKLREQKLLGGPTFCHLPLCFQKISKSFILNQLIYSTLIQKARATMPLAFCWNICWISLKSALYICVTRVLHALQHTTNTQNPSKTSSFNKRHHSVALRRSRFSDNSTVNADRLRVAWYKCPCPPDFNQCALQQLWG